MGQFLQTNGDYNIKTRDGGTIYLDTGDNIGNVRVTGNLIVEGDTLTVEAEDLNVKDNIIRVNFGETGPGVTLQYSGLEVDRGTESPASFIFDEASDSWTLAFGSAPGPFNFANSALRVRRILTSAAQDGGDLTLIGTGTGVVNVAGTVNYELQIADDDDIPNKKYVDDVLLLNPAFQIKSDDTWVIIGEKDTAGSLAFYSSETGLPNPGETVVSVVVDNTLNTSFYVDRVFMQDFKIENNSISPRTVDTDIFLETSGTGKVRTNYALRLDRIGSIPGGVVGSSVLLYNNAPSIGTSGVFFAHSARSGELISKNKALVFSMIF